MSVNGDDKDKGWNTTFFTLSASVVQNSSRRMVLLISKSLAACRRLGVENSILWRRAVTGPGIPHKKISQIGNHIKCSPHVNYPPNKIHMTRSTP
jgi:hypothetical protein